ncbi:copper amine oxidase-like domain-containing protein [Thermoanaerobacterium xylanolyticum LX-11]|uniref:Copper amine oxidase-like domain-containing protein n=1 Tax=Thermoanaerobacterium xylanolyticum (strain ATCC 49914 / DSM 7097 / LX-11) TaxID=858215 RepID=F6BJC3_THEXL|nr:phosphodiester glycosidase family protein [Thermoanaerobacterium xylanolyticum]AEF16891.1 copper amine oxidase-like domain-containing protein [Thermoanaerobacterium xylanolyticum LX-11]
MKKIPQIIVLLILVFIFSHVYADTYYNGFLYTYQNNSYMMVPARGVFQSMGADVKWDGDTQTVKIIKDSLQIVLKINSTNAVVNGEGKDMPVPAIIKNGSTFLPLRFLAELIGDNQVKWDDSTQTAAIPFNNSYIYVKAVDYSLDATSFTKKVDGVVVTAVRIPHNSPYKPAVILANNQIGTTQSLYDMAKYYNADIAINGTFFNAYGGDPVPWNTIIKDGKVVHIVNVGSVFGFTANGQVKMDKLRISIVGGTNGSYSWPNNWYAYGFNHIPSINSVYIFTSEWGSHLGFNYGINIVVENGVVKDIEENQDVNIPADGYVINLNGSEEYLAKVFNVGKTVDYKINFTNDSGNPVDWSDVVEAVGAGPTLVKDGVVSADPVGEGFTEDKIVSLSYARSAIGVTAQGDILLVTTPEITVYQLAQIMKDLGAYNAMNLDGGASSGLYFKGGYLTKPGRDLSNALIFYK